LKKHRKFKEVHNLLTISPIIYGIIIEVLWRNIKSQGLGCGLILRRNIKKEEKSRFKKAF